MARPFLLIVFAQTGQPATKGMGRMAALPAQSSAQADADGPDLRPQDRPGCCGTCLRDPAGHRIGLACHSIHAKAACWDVPGAGAA
ncbi:MAG: hypothetical protein IOD05_09045 [Rhodobacter sp.]|nr:hypothetical protein [Rhodobacter sp.]MCA3495143.1 hypothetical protein [Rhodobacter sp.]MCA3503379.1 hypothetical protein [Rhodobacter sp.]